MWINKTIYQAVFLIFLLSGCASIKTTPIQGQYLETPLEITTSLSYDKTWERIIDMFAKEGISISTIDKSSGLIVAGKTRFSSRYISHESGGNLINPNAFVVISSCSLVQGYDFKDYEPELIEGDWNVRIKTVEQGTRVNINLVNLYAKPPTTLINGEIRPLCAFDARSTGVFEKVILAQITKP